MSATTKAAHTPGPWRAVEWSCHAPTTISARRGTENVIIAECHGHGRHSDESLADACLIAAAPELLETLEDLLALVNSLNIPVPGSGAIYRAEKAVQKARRGQ